MTKFNGRQDTSQPLVKRLLSTLRWTKSSAVLLGLFFATVGLILYVWWPLAEELLRYVDWRGQWWRQMDWLLLGIFMVMSVLIIGGADIRRDALIGFVGMCGG